MSRGQQLLVALIAAATAAAGALHYSGAPGVATFIVSGVALAGLAWMVSFATEELGARFGPAITGFMQSTLGNLPEFFIVIFALSQHQLVVAQNSILGSLFSNALLVLGLVIVVGCTAAPDGVMRFRARLPNDTATLVLLVSFVIVIVGLSLASKDVASKHVKGISAIAAVAILIVYATWAWRYLRTDDASAPEPPSGRALLPLSMSLGLLGAAGVGAAFVSDWFVSAVNPAAKSLGITKAFIGLVIVAIAGNAVENVVGLVLARKGQNDLAISVVKNSVAQIAAFLFPALVLVSLVFFTTPLTFALAPVYIGALFVMAVAVWQVTGDGEAQPFEGWALVALFVMLGAFAWFE